MASGRFLSTSIADDDRLSKLSMTAEFVYLKAIPHLDRDGMITGKPGLIYSKVCPAREELFGQTQAVIDEWVQVGLVIRMMTDVGPVLFFPGFLKNNSLPHYDRERASRFPAPPGYIRTDKGLIPVNVQDEVLESVQDKEQDDNQDEVLENDLQDQEEDQDQEQQGDDDDTQARDPLHAAWFDTYREEMPPKIEKAIPPLVTECGDAAVIHGIRESVNAASRSFRFIAECARNYLPPPPPVYVNGAASYAVDLPGVHVMQPAEKPVPVALPPPMAHDDPWAVVLAELLPTLSSQAALWLKDSHLHESGELAGEPLYRVQVSHPAANKEWLTRQTERLIRVKLSGLLGKRVLVEFVIAEQEPAT